MPVVPRFSGCIFSGSRVILVLTRHACGHVLLPMHYPRGGCLSVCLSDTYVPRTDVRLLLARALSTQVHTP